MPEATPTPDDSRPPRVALVSLGCAKNRVDSESALGELLEGGFELAPEPSDADLILVNTCGFIQSARDESYSVLQEMLALRDDEGWPKVAALGCLSQREGETLLQRLPRLEAVFGLEAYGELSALCESILGFDEATRPARKWRLGKPTLRKKGQPCRALDGSPRLLTTPPSYAYLRISEGCDNRCAYCAIPRIRGPLHSRAPGAIVEEAKALAGEQGVSELVLVAQDTTAYGDDRKDTHLAALLEQLLAQTEVPRLRILYAHPGHLNDDVIALLGREPRLCRYLDLPIQHVNDDILAAMRRPYRRADLEDLLCRLRAACPDLVLRSTLLAGFPGESDAAFAELLDFVRSGQVQHLGAFAYSPEAETRAQHLPSMLEPAEIERRRDALLEAQQAVSHAWQESRAGHEVEVLVDRRLEADLWECRSCAEAPEVDPVIRMNAENLDVGGIFRACLTRRSGYDMEAIRAP